MEEFAIILLVSYFTALSLYAVAGLIMSWCLDIDLDKVIAKLIRRDE